MRGLKRFDVVRVDLIAALFWSAVIDGVAANLQEDGRRRRSWEPPPSRCRLLESAV